MFAITDAMDFTAGFDFAWPEGISFVIDPLSGEIVSMNL